MTLEEKRAVVERCQYIILGTIRRVLAEKGISQHWRMREKDAVREYVHVISVRLMERLDRYDPEKGTLLAYITGFTRLELLYYLRPEWLRRSRTRSFGVEGKWTQTESIGFCALAVTDFPQFQSAKFRMYGPASPELFSVERSLQEEQLRGMLQQALLRIPQQQRKVIESYYLQEKPLGQISEELQVGPSRVSALHKAGKENLKAVLQKMQPNHFVESRC